MEKLHEELTYKYLNAIEERQDSLSFDPNIYKLRVRYDEHGIPISTKQQHVAPKRKPFWSKQNKEECKNIASLDDNNRDAAATTASLSPTITQPQPAPVTWRTIAFGLLGLIGTAIGAWATVHNISETSQRSLVKQKIPAICGAHAALMGPYIVYQRRIIERIPNLRANIQALREDYNRLRKENEILYAHVNDLKANVNYLTEIKAALDDICVSQGTSLNVLNKKVQESAEINADLREVIESRTWQEIQSIILESDKDGDFILEHHEIEELILRLKVVETIEIDEDLLREDFKQNGGSLNRLLNFIREALVKGSTKNFMISVKNVRTLIEEVKSKRIHYPESIAKKK